MESTQGGDATMKGLKRLMGVATALSATGAAAWQLYERFQKRAVPLLDGTLHFPGLREPVEIVRDTWGVPHVYAQNEHDLFWVQGYLHATDRLFQMDFLRRMGSGRLSEVFGEATLELDRWARILLLRRTAERHWERQDERTRNRVVAYVAGINAAIDRMEATDAWPPEFRLLRYRPERWTAVDTLSVLAQVVLGFSEDFEVELVRDALKRLVGDGWEDIWPAYPVDTPIISLPGVKRGVSASNAWVVAGERSRTGAPLLANDPHMTCTTPAAWYEIHLHGGDFHVIGGSLPGVPGVVIGHNERIAWGITNSMADCQDLYIEERHPDEPNLFRFRDEWRQTEIVEERIRVRGRKQPEALRVVVTHHGPLVSDFLPDETRDLALRWTFYDPVLSLGGIFALNRAQNWGEFRAALYEISAPPLNVAYADVDGNIGWVVGGRLPVRRAHDGTLPVDGASGAYEWDGYIPMDEMPAVFNPDAGYVVHANNRPVDDSYPYPIGESFFPGYRAQRISERLEAEPQHDTSTFADIQLDTYGRPEHALAQAIARLEEVPPDLVVAQQALAAWDGHMNADSVAAALAATTLYRLRWLLVSDKLGAVGVHFVGRRMADRAHWPTTPLVYRSVAWVIEKVQNPHDSWWHVRGDPSATYESMLVQALQLAVNDLRARFDGRLPTWGELNRARLAHPLGQLPLVGRLFEPEARPISGSPSAPFASMTAAFAYVAESDLYAGPSWRFIADLHDWDACRAALPGGECGVPGTPYTTNLLDEWYVGQSHPLAFSREAVERVQAHRLVLEPGVD
ncbi:MAG: penicillin acylase family protein [Ardenticatenia bacterium]|nr:MAG: penicillin acylase family protein [Ardenticatenia bacterium]